jgi:hypothetical protein
MKFNYSSRFRALAFTVSISDLNERTHCPVVMYLFLSCYPSLTYSRQVQCLFSHCLQSRDVLGSGRHKVGALFSLSFAASLKAEITKLYADLFLDKTALLRDKIERTRCDLRWCLPFETLNSFQCHTQECFLFLIQNSTLCREIDVVYSESNRKQKSAMATPKWGSCPTYGYFLTDFISMSPIYLNCTSGCDYSFMYSWWWVQRTPETCRVILQYNKKNCLKPDLVGYSRKIE